MTALTDAQLTRLETLCCSTVRADTKVTIIVQLIREVRRLNRENSTLRSCLEDAVSQMESNFAVVPDEWRAAITTTSQGD